MAIPPSVNNRSEQEAALAAEAERKRLAATAASDAAAAKNASVVKGKSPIGDAIIDAGKWGQEAIKDTFSAEQVGGPPKGEWGTPGTQAGFYNADQHEEGAGVRGRMAGQAAAAGKVGAAGAGNAAAQAQAYDQRRAPTKNANRALGGAENTVAALNTFAGQQDGPSGAQAQLSSATQQGLAQQLAMARSGRGFGGNSANMGQAQSAMAGVTANAANQSAQLKAQEFASARERQLQALNSSMGGGISLGTQYGGQALQSQAQNDAAAAAQGRLGLDYNRFGADASLGYQKLGEESNLQHQELGQRALNQQAEYELAQQKMAMEAAKANQQADLEKDSGIGGMLSAAAGALFMSDRHSKEKIERLEGALASSLGNKGPALETVSGAPGYSYKYKDPTQPGAKAGRMVGPMAQDIERGPLGNTVVKDTPNGKMVDSGRLTMVNTSAIAEQQKQLDALKRALGRKAA